MDNNKQSKKQMSITSKEKNSNQRKEEYTNKPLPQPKDYEEIEY